MYPGWNGSHAASAARSLTFHNQSVLRQDDHLDILSGGVKAMGINPGYTVLLPDFQIEAACSNDEMGIRADVDGLLPRSMDLSSH
jgi:hypothetical protein